MHQAQLEEQVEALRAAGVVPAAIGLDAVGMARLWQAHAKHPSGLHAALHVREEGVSLSVAYGRSLAYFRCLTCTADAPESGHGGAGSAEYVAAGVRRSGEGPSGRRPVCRRGGVV